MDGSWSNSARRGLLRAPGPGGFRRTVGRGSRSAVVSIIVMILVGCESPRRSVSSIVRRQQEALSKLPEEDRARMMRPDELVGTVSAGQLVSPGLLELAEAREVALRANPSIHSARARLEAALARIAEARSFYFPQLALTHNSTRTMLTPSTRSRLTSGIASTPAIPQLPQDPTLTDILSLLQIPLLNRGSSTTSNANSFSDHSSILSATWTLFDGFAREARMMSAKYGYRASAMAVGDVERLVVQAVDTAYYQAQLGREQVRIARADEAFSREQLVDAEKRFEARKITKADVLNFEVRVRSAQADLVAAIGLRDTARVLLAELLGLSGAKLADDVDLAELEAETEEELTAPSTDDWIERALGGRPDYAQARHTVKARAEEVSLAQGQFSPELTLSGTYGFERASNLGYSVNDQSAAVGLELRWQLFTGGFRTSQVRRVQAEWWEAAAELERKRLEVVADVRSTTVGLIDAQEQVRLQRLNLESARENRRIVQLEYSAGKASLVRLNEAQRDYVNTDAELARSRIRLRQAWSDLRASAGAYSSHGSAEAESAP